MNWAESFTYFWMILLWVLGIAVSPWGWKAVCAIFIPPAAWVFAVQWAIGL